jgi:hypothetical protein
VSIIVGVHCSDCVILACSGPAPASTPGGAVDGVIETRLRAVAGQAIVGSSGPEELDREVTAALERYLAEHGPHRMSGEAHRRGMQTVLGQPIRLTAEMTRALQRLPGTAATAGELVAGAVLIALPSKERSSLHLIDAEGRVSQIEGGRCFATIGSARVAAESFLIFLQRLLWREKKPNRAAGQLAAYWTARHITEIEGASSRSIQVVRLSSAEGGLADVIWYRDSVIAALRRAVDAGLDEIRAGIKRRVMIDFEVPTGEALPAPGQPPLRRVPEVKVTLHPPQEKDKRPRW